MHGTAQAQQVKKDVTMGTIHRATGISRSHVSRIFSGDRNPSLETAHRIARILGVTVDEFIEDFQNGTLREMISSTS